MGMEDGLSGERSGVEDKAVLPATVIVSELLHHRDDLGQQRGVGRGKLRHIGELLGLRHHEQVHGSLGCNVAQRDDPLVLEDDVRRDLARDNAREEGWLRCDRHVIRVSDATALSMRVRYQRPSVLRPDGSCDRRWVAGQEPGRRSVWRFWVRECDAVVSLSFWRTAIRSLPEVAHIQTSLRQIQKNLPEWWRGLTAAGGA